VNATQRTMRGETLTKAVQTSHAWMDACSTLVDGVESKTTLRARVAVVLHHLCIEHHQAGHVLVDTGAGAPLTVSAR
jgi:hypothetical protein